MFIVGITGGIGSGKSAVTTILQTLNIQVVDADIVAREVVEHGSPALEAIKQRFGPEALLADGSLNRAKLRGIIFNKPEEKSWLESLLHPLIRESIICQLNNTKSDYCVLASPLLFETNQHQLTDFNVVVDTPEELQIERTTKRDGNTESQVKSIIQSQLPRADRNAKADYLIINESSLEDLKAKVALLHQVLLEKAEQKNEQT